MSVYSMHDDDCTSTFVEKNFDFCSLGQNNSSRMDGFSRTPDLMKRSYPSIIILWPSLHTYKYICIYEYDYIHLCNRICEI